MPLIFPKVPQSSRPESLVSSPVTPPPQESLVVWRGKLNSEYGRWRFLLGPKSLDPLNFLGVGGWRFSTLLGQWLNGLNFLGLYIYIVGKIKFKLFFPGSIG